MKLHFFNYNEGNSIHWIPKHNTLSRNQNTTSISEEGATKGILSMMEETTNSYKMSVVFLFFSKFLYLVDKLNNRENLTKNKIISQKNKENKRMFVLKTEVLMAVKVKTVFCHVTLCSVTDRYQTIWHKILEILRVTFVHAGI